MHMMNNESYDREDPFVLFLQISLSNTYLDPAI